MTILAPALIIGSRDDVHVERVARLVSKPLLVLDAASLPDVSLAIDFDTIDIETEHARWRFASGTEPGRGWVRRLAPEDWQVGVVGGSRTSAEHSAWLSLLGAIGRSPLVRWLTGLDAGLIAENKHHQLAMARTAGIPVPRTMATNSASEAGRRMPEPRIVKALGRAHFVQRDEARVIFAQPLDDERLNSIDVDVPLIFQERLDAVAHLRVVVVRNRVWAASLPASGLPLDWRSEPAAHDSFEQIEVPSSVRRMAPKVARSLSLGYSSQDWILTKSGPFLVDVNPGGQWLFLPEPIATEVAKAIATWLEGS